MQFHKIIMLTLLLASITIIQAADNVRPLGQDVVKVFGSVEDIDAETLQDLSKFYKESHNSKEVITQTLIILQQEYQNTTDYIQAVQNEFKWSPLRSFNTEYDAALLVQSLSQVEVEQLIGLLRRNFLVNTIWEHRNYYQGIKKKMVQMVEIERVFYSEDDIRNDHTGYDRLHKALSKKLDACQKTFENMFANTPIIKHYTLETNTPDPNECTGCLSPEEIYFTFIQVQHNKAK